MVAHVAGTEQPTRNIEAGVLVEDPAFKVRSLNGVVKDSLMSLAWRSTMLRAPQNVSPSVRGLFAARRSRLVLWVLMAIGAIPVALWLYFDHQPSPVVRELNEQQWVGDWKGEGYELEIRPDGRMMFRERSGAGTHKRGGKVRGIDGGRLRVWGYPGPFEFSVSQPPHEDAGEWSMTVDGRELRRVRSQRP